MKTVPDKQRERRIRMIALSVCSEGRWMHAAGRDVERPSYLHASARGPRTVRVQLTTAER